MSVKVGVRVRPFNQREKDLNCELCVQMIGPMTRLIDKSTEKLRDFTFDYSFWSHDQFTPDFRGYFKPDNQKYADQQLVFNEVGEQILKNAWQGYHCCLFAYGQTGAGKSYSMVGYGANKGIVPISCVEIFKRIEQNKSDKQFQVSISMLQIYNEKVQDLLIPIPKRHKQGLKIRQHPTLGVYVDGLSKHCVQNYQQIQSKMDQGNKNRSIASTEMNASSSRAHTIISIQFKQIQVVQGKKKQKLSVIFLVDLAGSEKVGKTGAVGDRLKEAAGINKSLTILGLVIEKLAEKSMGKDKNIFIPYRDSCLTRILQNALGGNSKTLMICAISPASDNYDQTLSTLRYADQAKKIKNVAVVNESQTDKIIRALRQQKTQLQIKLSQLQQKINKFGSGQKQIGLVEQIDATENQIKQYNKIMMDYQQKPLKQFKIIQQAKKQKDQSISYLYNLNQDSQLTRRIIYYINKQSIKIGRKNDPENNDIGLKGISIRSLHATIHSNYKNIFIQPIFEGQSSFCFVNGIEIQKQTQLFNNDRISFGRNIIFILKSDQQQKQNQKVDTDTIDWQFAQNQLYSKNKWYQEDSIKINNDRQLKLRNEGLEKIKKKQQQLAILQIQLQSSKQKRLNLEEQTEIEKTQNLVKKQYIQNLKKYIQEEKFKDQSTREKTYRNFYYLEKQLRQTQTKCIEINLIAKLWNRKVNLQFNIFKPYDDEESFKQVKVKVINLQAGYSYYWDTVKLDNRYYLIKQLWQDYLQVNILPKVVRQNDPLWDPPQHTLIGQSYLSLKSLAFMLDNPIKLDIIDYQGFNYGSLEVDLIPTDSLGKINLSQKYSNVQQFDIIQLYGTQLYCNIIIKNVYITIQKHKISHSYSNCYVEYRVRNNFSEFVTFRTIEFEEESRNPCFNYQKLLLFGTITKQLIQYLNNNSIVFRTYGIELFPSSKNQEGIKLAQKHIMNQQSIKKDKYFTNNQQIAYQKVVDSHPIDQKYDLLNRKRSQIKNNMLNLNNSEMEDDGNKKNIQESKNKIEKQPLKKIQKKKNPRQMLKIKDKRPQRDCIIF